ncbi:MAG TPA: hypothetical protein DCZ94_20530 [Lentisphaeria bacterium]|nr:MAG: hypothetical protein A2X48_16375 [Lentisphaerae bacterium GWF2_49_21]HBC89334.1 hypothetical protein [Lentisphaeria bacterium]
MRKLLVIFLLVSAVPAFAIWHDDLAKFRLEVKPEKADVILMIELHGMIFPSSLKNGVAVYSGGKKLAHHLDKESNVLFTGKVPPGENSFVYFGFDEPRPFENWNEAELGKIPEPQKLRLLLNNGRLDNTQEADMLANRNYMKYLEIKKMEMKISAIEQDFLLSKRKMTDADKMDLEERRADVRHKSAPANIPASDLRRFREREREMERFFRQDMVPNEVSSVKKVLLDQTPSSKNRNFVAQFTGSLLIAEAGIYSFAINSRNASHLVIDDKLVVAWPFNHEKSEGWEKTGDVYLEPGLHVLSYCFHRNRGVPYAAAAWKRNDEKEFKILAEKDFTPAYRASILNCSDKNGIRNPIVKYEIKGHFFIDREKKADWLQCEVEKAGNDFTPVWKAGSEIVSENLKASFALERKSDIPVYLSSKENAFPDIKIEIPEELVKESDSKIIEPDLYMKLRAPSFIFDDETLEMDVEIYSGLPLETLVLLRTSPSGINPMFKKDVSWIELEPRKDIKTNPFTQEFVYKKKFELNGGFFARGQFKVKFTLGVPPMTMSDESIRFVLLAECPELKCDNYGMFYDMQGKRVVPVLHRPTLAEKRTWSFAESLVKELTPTRKILVVADDFGEDENLFSARLGKLLKGKGIGLEFAAWTREENTPAMSASLGNMMRIIAKSDADKVVIIPSAWDNRMSVSSRQQIRTLSAVIQTVQANKKVKSLVLSTPYPTLDDNPIETEVVKGVRQDLKRDYGIEEILDLNSYLRSRPGWKASYLRNSSSPSLYTSFPVNLADEICKMVLDSN